MNSNTEEINLDVKLSRHEVLYAISCKRLKNRKEEDMNKSKSKSRSKTPKFEYEKFNKKIDD